MMKRKLNIIVLILIVAVITWGLFGEIVHGFTIFGVSMSDIGSLIGIFVIICLSFKMLKWIIEGFQLLFFPKSQRKLFNAMLDGLLKIRKKPAPRFQVPRKLRRAINKRRSVGDTEANLKYLTEQILIHMGLPKDSVKLNVIHSQHSSYSQLGAGQIGRYLGAEREIEFILTDDHKFWTIVAVLAHECAHHLHHLKGVNMKVHKYELYTDFTAIFYGFIKYLEKGYNMEKAEYFEDKVYTLRIGYLENRDYVYIRWLLFKHRFLRR